MNPAAGWASIILVSLATAVIGAFGLRISRTTSDFYVASRTVGPMLNASAIGGEYLSAASFLGIAGLILTYGADMLWYPVGWTAGYLVLLLLVAAPLRRRGAYTLPDFTEARLESGHVRRLSSLLVCLIVWLYLMPQFQGAGITLQTVTGAPSWLGGVVVGAVVLFNAVAGGMRSITFVQAFQYWLKLAAIALPLIFLVSVWHRDGAPSVPTNPLPAVDLPSHTLYSTYSLILATFLGTMGLPHVLVRFYTNPDGRQARRTTLVVLGLLGQFYLMPTIYGALGRIYAPDLAGQDRVVLELPGRMVAGLGGDLLGSLVAARAFAAFLSTCSGLTVSVAGVLSQDLISRRGALRLPGVAAFRVAGCVAVAVPLLLALVGADVPVANAVGLAFAVAASTFCPLLVLGIWWRGRTARGASAGLAVGGLLSGFTVISTIATDLGQGWVDTLLAQPAAWSVPAAFATMIVVSRATHHRVPAGLSRIMVRLHAPEQIDVDRGPEAVRRSRW
ncbi:MAG: cation acetate symporter [Nocardioidaceae bacterium]